MDQRVLLANANKRYDNIFQGLGILNQQARVNVENLLEAIQILHEKEIELDNKLDLLLTHFGIEIPVVEESPVVDAPEETTETPIENTDTTD